MTEHLPECPLLEPCSADIPQHGFCSRQNTICIHCDQNTICIHCERECICDRLRACEERVLDAALKSLYLMENVGGYPEFDFDHIRDDFRDVIDSLKKNP